jgi:glutamyl-tRNA synthetase
MIKQVRVRFAPSPTGHLHIGSLRTAVFNWLFARHNNGKFLIRIEDTDQERSTTEYVESILSSLQWMGIDSDEEIIFQSAQQSKQQKYLDMLFASGRAYRCFCAQKRSEVAGEYFKYDGNCFAILPENIDLTKPHVIRFRLPEFAQERLSFIDVVRGEVGYPFDQLDDFIIARSDGTFMYNFAVVIDDALMQISHVIRGDDHLNNTFKQILLYEALGIETPKFVHIPLILNESGSKLSKRDAAVSVTEYRKQGYLADALFNYLVRLGWSHGNDEIFSKSEMIKYFTLENVGKSGAVFDVDKLQWLNGVYIRNENPIKLVQLINRDVDPTFENEKLFSNQQIINIVGLYKERIKTLSELCAATYNLSVPPKSYDVAAIEKWVSVDTKLVLIDLLVELQEIEDWTFDNISTQIKDFAKIKNLKLGQIAQPIRISLTGSTSSPSVFHLLEILEKAEVLKRINQFLEFVSSLS